MEVLHIFPATFKRGSLIVPLEGYPYFKGGWLAKKKQRNFGEKNSRQNHLSGTHFSDVALVKGNTSHGHGENNGETWWSWRGCCENIKRGNMIPGTLKLTANAPENRPGPRRKHIFQPSIFRCELLVSGSVRSSLNIIFCIFGWVRNEKFQPPQNSLEQSFRTGYHLGFFGRISSQKSHHGCRTPKNIQSCYNYLISSHGIWMISTISMFFMVYIYIYIYIYIHGDFLTW